MKRWKFYVNNLPKVWRRWGVHFLWILFPDRLQNAFPPQSVREWFSDLFFYTLDVLYFPLWYEWIWVSLKPSSRRLSDFEKNEAFPIFGGNLAYDLVLIDPKPRIGLGKDVIAYVTFFTINYKKNISMPVLIHELVHVWQYQHFGAVYIGKALKAQKSKEGYNYGGMENLYHEMLKGTTLTHFNFEQQAEILEDYYRACSGGNHSPMVKSVFGYYVGMIKEASC